MSMSLDALAEAALGFANELRGVHGKEPVGALVPGVIGSCCGCTVAMTAGGWVPGKEPGWEVGARAVFLGPRGAVKLDYCRTPDEVRELMAAFDAGALPDLVVAPVAA